MHNNTCLLQIMYSDCLIIVTISLLSAFFAEVSPQNEHAAYTPLNRPPFFRVLRAPLVFKIDTLARAITLVKKHWRVMHRNRIVTYVHQNLSYNDHALFVPIVSQHTTLHSALQ